MNIETLAVVASLLVTVAIGLWSVFRTRKVELASDEYFLGRGFMVGNRVFFSIYATTFSAFTVVGLPAMYFTHGIGTFFFMWIGMALTPLTLYTIGRKLVQTSNSEVASFKSPVGLLTKGYGSSRLTQTIAVVTIVALFPYLTLQIAGVGKFIVSFSDGQVSYVLATLICCAVVGLYIIKGGAKADIETDFWQGLIMIVATVIIAGYVGWLFFQDGDENIAVLSEAGLLSLPGPKGYFHAPLLVSFGVIFGLITIATPQVSQKLMGLKDVKALRPTLIWYPILGTIALVLAGLIGLYGAAKLQVASPDFVAGDVMRSLRAGSGFAVIGILCVTIMFGGAVVSAAVSTIDSCIIAITGIVGDALPSNTDDKGVKVGLKVAGACVLLGALYFSQKPPLLIVSLAQIQLSGLTALLPCLFGPMIGVKNAQLGWLLLLLGLVPVILGRVIGVTFGGFDPGVVGLSLGLFAIGLIWLSGMASTVRR